MSEKFRYFCREGKNTNDFFAGKQGFAGYFKEMTTLIRLSGFHSSGMILDNWKIRRRIMLPLS